MHNRNNILLIEDQKSLAQDVVKYLSDNNYKCTHVTSIKNAKLSLKNSNYNTSNLLPLISVWIPNIIFTLIAILLVKFTPK